MYEVVEEPRGPQNQIIRLQFYKYRDVVVLLRDHVQDRHWIEADLMDQSIDWYLNEDPELLRYKLKRKRTFVFHSEAGQRLTNPSALPKEGKRTR